MEAAGKTATFFNTWFENLTHFKRAHDLHVTIGALCEILALPEQQLPAAVVAGLPFTVPAILNAVAQLPQAYKRKQELKDYIEAEENGEIEDMDPYEEEPGALELGDDDDYADEEGDAYLQVRGHTCIGQWHALLCSPCLPLPTLETPGVSCFLCRQHADFRYASLFKCCLRCSIL